jgi:uncharacterized RDD family membrane protein YckC
MSPGDVPPAPGAATAGYASVTSRFGANLLDGLVSLLAAVPGFVMLFAGPTEISSCSVDSEGNIDFSGADNALCEGPTGGTIAMAVVLFAVLGIALFIYQASLLSKRGQTIGKRAVGVRVVDADTGAYLSFGRALGRQVFAFFISGNVCLLGYLWALWDPRKQTWHDKVAGSIVVPA